VSGGSWTAAKRTFGAVVYPLPLFTTPHNLAAVAPEDCWCQPHVLPAGEKRVVVHNRTAGAPLEDS
jgi:hypothetical protein